MAKVKIATKRQTGFGCPTTFRGLVTVDGVNEEFEVHYRGWGLTVTVCGTDLRADGRGDSDGVCTWDEIKDAVLAALREYFNSDRYAERLRLFQECA